MSVMQWVFLCWGILAFLCIALGLVLGIFEALGYFEENE